VDALIYLTDGDGSFPGQSPDYPTLWIFIESKVEDPPFGAVIRIK
jgi:predicted metal-dependent peptidase